MKEKKEENLTNRRNSLLKEYNKKQKIIENQLYRIRESKEGERKKHLLLLQQKEELALFRKKRKEEKEERQRLKYETQISTKSN